MITAESQTLFELFLVGLINAHMPPPLELPVPLPQSITSAAKITRKDIQVLATGEFKKGQSCIKGFKQIGYTITVQQCILSAKDAGIVPVWSRPKIDKPANIIIPVKEGDPFAVVEVKGVRHYILYKKPIHK